MKKILLLSLLLNSYTHTLISDEHAEIADCNSDVFEFNEKNFSKNFEGTFNGKRIEYRASVKQKILYERDDYKSPTASFFYTEYIVDDNKNRTIIFSFNVVPGSASLLSLKHI